jgi:hypothetical protein
MSWTRPAQRLVVIVALVAGLALLPEPASASELIGRDASDVGLEVDRSGRARVTFTSGGARQAVLAWGAVDALPPTPGRRQVRFTIVRTGAGGGFGNACRPYAGPPLAWLVTACTAPDGSHWAVQAWQRRLPNYGAAADAERAAWELRLSHWRGEPATLRIELDWSYRRFHHLFGSLTYQGRPVHGFSSTSTGEPVDDFGRNVYVDTLGSPYGSGWKRENSFLAHRPTGAFCYGFYPHDGRPAGTGTRYRATVIGPGVSPDVMWQGAAPGAFDAARDAAANDRQRTLFRGDRLCKVN